jgi:hypothetical protein
LAAADAEDWRTARGAISDPKVRMLPYVFQELEVDHVEQRTYPPSDRWTLATETDAD